MTQVIVGNKISLSNQVAQTLKQRIRVGQYCCGIARKYLLLRVCFL